MSSRKTWALESKACICIQFPVIGPAEENIVFICTITCNQTATLCDDAVSNQTLTHEQTQQSGNIITSLKNNIKHSCWWSSCVKTNQRKRLYWKPPDCRTLSHHALSHLSVPTGRSFSGAARVDTRLQGGSGECKMNKRLWDASILLIKPEEKA